jgi:hypothetical protein
MGMVEVTAAATIWALFACFLLFPHLGLPAMMHRAAATLLVAELVALAMWSYGSKGCVQRPCAPAAEAGRTAASLDIPLLAVALIALAFIRGVRVWRRFVKDAARAPRPSPESPAAATSQARERRDAGDSGVQRGRRVG